MPTVFLSHSSEDKEFVERELIPVLKSRGIGVWYSSEAIQTAEQWERAIRRGLESSDWFLVALSTRSAQSKWVRAEMGWAFANREGRIVPVLIEACDLAQFPIWIPELQFADFRRDRRKGAERLLTLFDASPVQPGSPLASPESAEQMATEDTFPLKALGHAFMLKGDFDGAITELDGALELNSRDSGALILRGVCELGRSNWDGAIGDLTRGIEAGPNPLALSLTYFYRARAYISKNDRVRALADCSEALKADQNNADAFLFRGKLRRINLDRQGALADLNEAVTLKPSAEAYLQRAEAFRDLNDTDKARADYAEAVKLDPSAAEKVPIHLQGESAAAPSASGIEEALGSLRVMASFTQMDSMPPAAKAKMLSEMMAIGFPKIMADLGYLVKHLPKGSKEHQSAVLLDAVARKAGLMN